MEFNREETLKKSLEFFSSGKFEDALQYTQTILNHYPEDLQVMTLMSIIKEVSGEKEEAEKLLNKVLEINPNYPEALYFSGIRVGKKGDYKQSVQLIQKAIEYQSKDAKKELSIYYQNLGSALWKLNLRFDAFNAWGKAVELNPDQEVAKEYLEKFSNEYGMPISPTKTFDDFYAFQSIKVKEYMEKNNKKKFDNTDEANKFLEKIIKVWGIIVEKENLSELSKDEKIKIFMETRIEY
jgi:tetratricopeptide (TPR) repeat protein